MLNELFSIKPESAEHATYLERRRSSLLRRLSALEDQATPSPPSLEESMGTSGSTTENAMTEANLSDNHSFEQTAASYENENVLASPAKLSAVCPVVLENVTSLSLSATQSSFYSSSFPPLAQPSQISSEVDESQVYTDQMCTYS
ncbi:hypothetical protein L915_05487 [Phytophthora nicotianae]|uniref:Uncharacterized protein n=1 Tax=Phytophthora nicotianae TaxID=4792 RepID=W2H6C4_PHYNI|nr:hypothetical protein L915_05487 [Phytophthora nicotianae]